jgi:hypothetical protein
MGCSVGAGSLAGVFVEVELLSGMVVGRGVVFEEPDPAVGSGVASAEVASENGISQAVNMVAMISTRLSASKRRFMIFSSLSNTTFWYLVLLEKRRIPHIGPVAQHRGFCFQYPGFHQTV